MLRTRIIPCLLLKDQSLVKTVQFQKFNYIGDPINTVRIFNELEVDELCFLDIRATLENREPNKKILAEIADECFMPLSYGGGIKDLATARSILSIGFEKVILNTAAIENSKLVSEIAEYSGSQSVIASIDVKKTLFGKYSVYSKDGSHNTKKDPVEWARQVEKLGAGEILLTSINREGTWDGFDIELVRQVSDAVSIPVIASGGAGNIEHIGKVVHDGKASAVALGSMVVFQKKDLGVLVNFPDSRILEKHMEL
jgi:imidazole glycerol-phosphate synthase subunit HisF